MAITARSHGFFDNAIVGWSHAARSDVTYSAAKIVFAIFILIYLLSLFLKTSLSNGSGNMA